MTGPTLKIAKRSKMPPFMAMDVMRLAAELDAQGHDIVHLEVGQPSSSAPKPVMDALVDSMGQQNHTDMLWHLELLSCARE